MPRSAGEAGLDRGRLFSAGVWGNLRSALTQCLASIHAHQEKCKRRVHTAGQSQRYQCITYRAGSAALPCSRPPLSAVA